ncbi:hypothetical protein P2G88_03300 [Aliiglaciecola sp. CAU 1673]|uniref:hypothetical protein n=1 Tax=Aliiglaciecola sp. CAU 1673 TaxID=3032595 RepID=UPI0023DA5D0B|nr:hypothetical protein [Aliiglaciecola sp. CAU 1673]MDF2177268.1 hypothetical protein [Aliiglaciecola sp. CAU 1673]
MLINSIILFLRDALPVFVLASFLLAWSNHTKANHHWLGWGTVLGLSGALILTALVNVISQWQEGAGLELILFCSQSLAYLFLILIVVDFCRAQHSHPAFALAAFAITVMLNGANLLVYLWGYWAFEETPLALILGTVMGLALCFSLAVLLYLAAYHLLLNGARRAFICLVLLYAAGQLTQAFTLLSQVDLLPSFPSLWDSSAWISDESEVGHLLNSLMGYEEAPGPLQLLVYFLAVGLPLLGLGLSRQLKLGKGRN